MNTVVYMYLSINLLERNQAKLVMKDDENCLVFYVGNVTAIMLA